MGFLKINFLCRKFYKTFYTASHPPEFLSVEPVPSFSAEATGALLLLGSRAADLYPVPNRDPPDREVVGGFVAVGLELASIFVGWGFINGPKMPPAVGVAPDFATGVAVADPDGFLPTEKFESFASGMGRVAKLKGPLLVRWGQ